MRLHRLSYQAAGAGPFSPRAEPQPRTPSRSLAPAAPAPAAPYGSSAARARRRRIALVALLAVHAVAIVGLLDASRLRQATADARPLFLAVVDAPARAAPPRPLPLPSAPGVKLPPPPQVALPPIATEPAPGPAPLAAQVAPPALAASLAPVDPAPAPLPTLPRTIPPSAVQYLVPPAPLYSRISARLRESGKAVVRVFIDEAGLPRQVQLASSTGFARLDDAALAAVRNCRFKPYLDNGVAVAGWAAVPIEFELPT